MYEGGDNVIFIDDSIVEIMSWWKQWGVRYVHVRQHWRELLWSVMVMISCVFTQRVVLWCEAIETLICHKECYVQAACSLRCLPKLAQGHTNLRIDSQYLRWWESDMYVLLRMNESGNTFGINTNSCVALYIHIFLYQFVHWNWRNNRASSAGSQLRWWL